MTFPNAGAGERDFPEWGIVGSFLGRYVREREPEECPTGQSGTRSEEEQLDACRHLLQHRLRCSDDRPAATRRRLPPSTQEARYRRLHRTAARLGRAVDRAQRNRPCCRGRRLHGLARTRRRPSLRMGARALVERRRSRAGSSKKVSVFPSMSVTTRRRGACLAARCATFRAGERDHVDRAFGGQPPNRLGVMREHVCRSTKKSDVPVIGVGVVGHRQSGERVRDHTPESARAHALASLPHTGAGEWSTQ